MPKPKGIKVTSTVTRHMPQFSRLVTIPLEKVAPWKLTETTVIDGEVNGTALGRRSLKRWDDRNCWWIDLPDAICKKAKLDTGDKVELMIRLASDELPEELAQLLATNGTAKGSWERLTKAQQRMLREEIYSAKSSEARLRRAAKALTHSAS